MISFKPLDLIDKFVTYLSENIDKGNEIELTLYNTNLQCFTNLYQKYNKYNINKSSTKDSPFILKTYFTIQARNQFEKYRQYIPFSTFNNYNIINSNISDQIKKSIWNVKRTVNFEKLTTDSIDYGSLACYIEDEERLLSNSYYYKNDTSFRIYFNREINVRTENFNLNLRFIVNLKNDKDTNKRLQEYYSNTNRLEGLENIKLEIEYLKPKDEDNKYINVIVNKKLKEIWKKELYDLFGLVYGYTELSELHILIQNISINLKTYVDYHKDILEKDLNELAITPKIDGTSVYFEIENSTLKLYLEYRLFIVKTNINPVDRQIRGFGEFVNKTIYPFYIFGNGNRIKLLNEFFELINDDNTKFKFERKIFISNFVDYLDLFRQINFLLTKEYINYEIDGLIVLDPNNNDLETIVDYKLKEDNTVDILFMLNVSAGGPLIYNGNSFEFVVNGYYYNNKYINDKIIEAIRIVPSVENNTFYDTNLNMIVFDNDKVVPNHFIAEFSYLQNKIIRPRINKSNRLITEKYKGNYYDIILKSKNFYEVTDNENKIINRRLLCEILSNVDLPTDISLISKFFTSPGEFYSQTANTTSNIRGFLNLITNFFKTCIISNNINKFISKKNYTSVLDIDAGNGGDMNKLYFMGIKTVVATDKNLAPLQEYIKRHTTLNKDRRKGRLYGLFTSVVSIVDSEFKSKIEKLTDKPFDAINYQLAIHFYWNKLEIPIIINNLNYFAKNNAPILITTNNGDKIKDLLINKKELKLLVNSRENIFFRITKINEEKIKVNYSSSTINEGSEEFLVLKDSIISAFEQSNFRLHDTFTFDIIYNFGEMEYIFEKLRDYSNRGSSKDLFSKLLEYLSYETNNEDIKTLLSLFNVYVFYKI